MAASDLTAQRVRELLDYNPESGVFTWRLSVSSRAQAGNVAGSMAQHGYRVIGIARSPRLAHRIAWLHFYGVMPTYFIDHIDGDPSNNAIGNLRDVPQTVNTQNQHRAHRDSKSGYLGVSFNRSNNKWQAQIKWGGNIHFIGGFSDPKEAHLAYLEAKRKKHIGCSI